MIRLYLILIVSSFTILLIGQDDISVSSKGKKGDLYFYWGYNWKSYSKSNIHFKGEGFDFTLNKVVGTDRQTKFSLDNYFNPGRLTIPQFNFRLGYFINNKYNISIGLDHMKYIMQQNQFVTIE